MGELVDCPESVCECKSALSTLCLPTAVAGESDRLSQLVTRCSTSEAGEGAERSVGRACGCQARRVPPLQQPTTTACERTCKCRAKPTSAASLGRRRRSSRSHSPQPRSMPTSECSTDTHALNRSSASRHAPLHFPAASSLLQQRSGSVLSRQPSPSRRPARGHTALLHPTQTGSFETGARPAFDQPLRTPSIRVPHGSSLRRTSCGRLACTPCRLPPSVGPRRPPGIRTHPFYCPRARARSDELGQGSGLP